ncbi:hypothetical protein D3C80_2193490 [compost metagenome]
MQIAVAAEELQRFVRHIETRVSDKALGHCRPFARVVGFAIKLAGSGVKKKA